MLSHAQPRDALYNRIVSNPTSQKLGFQRPKVDQGPPHPLKGFQLRTYGWHHHRPDAKPFLLSRGPLAAGGSLGQAWTYSLFVSNSASFASSAATRSCSFPNRFTFESVLLYFLKSVAGVPQTYVAGGTSLVTPA